MALSPQKKAAKTRAMNRMAYQEWALVIRPAHERCVALANEFLTSVGGAKVRFVERPGGPRLSKGTGYGTLLKIEGTGLSWVVHVDGYRGKPHSWSTKFWEFAE